MNHFFAGFEKRSFNSRALKAIGLSGLAAGGVVVGSHLLGRATSSTLQRLAKKDADSDIEKVISHYKKKYKNMPEVLTKDEYPSPHYEGGAHVVRSNKDAGTLSHELAHATGPLSLSSGEGSRLGSIYSSLAHKDPEKDVIALYSIPIAALVKNKSIQTAVLATPFLVAAPNIIEEGQAAFRGIKNIKESLGNEAALKALPSALVGFGSYIAAPAITTLGAYAATKAVGL
jgi:hypothetical protein